MPEWSGQFYPWAHLVGRILFGMVFVVGGVTHLAKLNDVAATAQSRGVPASKGMTALRAIVIVAAGLTVILGWHRFIGAGLLAIVVVMTAFTMHAFWKVRDPAIQMNEMSHFLKDLGLAGAALLIAYYAGWEWPMAVGG